MANQAGDKFTRHLAYQHQSKVGYISRHTWAAPVAAAVANVLAAQSVAALVTTGITNPDFTRVLSVSGGGGTHTASGNVVVNGHDYRGAVISDTFALSSNATVVGVKAFKDVTSVDLTGVSGIGAASTVSVGVSAKLGLGRLCSADTAIFGNSDGTYEATRPVISFSATVISQNFVTFNTAPNAAHNFALVYETEDLYTGA